MNGIYYRPAEQRDGFFMCRSHFTFHKPGNPIRQGQNSFLN